MNMMISYQELVRTFPISELTIISGVILFLFNELIVVSSCFVFSRTGSITGLKRLLGTMPDSSLSAVNSNCLPLSKGKYIYRPFQCSLIVFWSALSDETD